MENNNIMTTVKNINGQELTMKNLLLRIKYNWLLNSAFSEKTDLKILGKAVAISNEKQLEKGLAMDIVLFICHNTQLFA